MASTILLAAVVFVITCESAFALNCYTCVSNGTDRTCVNPIDVNVVQSIDCTNQKTRIVSRFFGPDTGMEENVRRAADETNDFECIAYEIIYRDTQINETVRDCYLKLPNINSCDIVKSYGQVGTKYDMKNCETCGTDNCNARDGNSAASLHSSAFICVLLCLIRIRFN